ncbi:mitochondrial 54S ribosomal protein uL30m [Calcarisporiella thermophila]|uniref:mitochondrial 54S ribosomal protein uL30m n=1 Tax=Calcarisporiella thermophila TaxID=911321 RepID=UPI003742E440
MVLINQIRALATSTTPSKNHLYKITLIRSPIGLPEKTRNVTRALGFYRLKQTVYKPQTPTYAGMILKIKELVRVENVDQIGNDKKRPDRGYVVVGRVNN